MSAYSTSFSAAVSATSAKLSLTPVTYEIRIPRISFAYVIADAPGSPGWTSATVQYYSGGTTGGSSAAISPMRAGSPAATATAKSSYTGGSGTLYTIDSFAASGADYFAGNFQFQPPYDFVLTPGSSLACTFTVGGAGTGQLLFITAFFEELLLSWHQ